MSFIPDIAASKVAGLCGLHKYQDQSEVMFGLLYKHIPIKTEIDAIMSAENRKPITKVKNDILRNRDVMNIVGRAVRSMAGLEDITPVIQNLESQAKTILSLRFTDLPQSFRDEMVGEIRGAVYRQRGLQNENKALNNYETVHTVEVEQRNTTSFKKSYEKFKLNGRTDGYVAEHKRIVDAKERTRWWSEPPVYDEIQLRVYMELSGAIESELFETFPDGRTRTTKYTNDPEKWATILNSILDAVDKMNSAIINPAELREIVFANTM
jgi:hypothetical protein